MRLRSLRKRGIIAVVVEIVRQSDGHLLSQKEWETICECCESAGLYLIVDESLTAIRCGAPFAYQLRQYRKYKPSFVIFGKALAPGIAIVWDGLHVKRFGIVDQKDRVHLSTLWDLLPSQVQEPTATLRSWGTIVWAERENWVQRAQRLGVILRSVVRDLCPGVLLGGEGALIYLPSAVSRTADVVGAATPTHCRWMPYLDSGMMDDRQVRSLFGREGSSFRQALKLRLKRINKFCIICAEQAADSFWHCKRCDGYICNICEGPDVHRHHYGECLSLDI